MSDKNSKKVQRQRETHLAENMSPEQVEQHKLEMKKKAIKNSLLLFDYDRYAVPMLSAHILCQIDLSLSLNLKTMHCFSSITKTMHQCIESTGGIENSHNSGYEQIARNHAINDGTSCHFMSKNMIYHPFSQPNLLKSIKTRHTDCFLFL